MAREKNVTIPPVICALAFHARSKGSAETARSEKRALSEIPSARTARDGMCHARDGQREKRYDTACDLRACVSCAQQRQRGGISAVRLRFTRTVETARSEKRALSEIPSARTARDRMCHARDGRSLIQSAAEKSSSE